MRGFSRPSLWAGASLLLFLPLLSLRAGESAQGIGWVCGGVMDEAATPMSDTALLLFPDSQGQVADAQAVARVTSDNRGAFCLTGVPEGFYDLRAQKEGWPVQLPRRVEVRAGQVNRLTSPVELELEPGEPRVSYGESFDGMPAGQGRALLRDLLQKGDQDSLEEAARRFLPKGGVRTDLRALTSGLDVKPLVDLLVRKLEGTVLPPLKTARYIYLVSELADPRNETAVIPLLLRRLGDGRTLPGSRTTSDRPTYVSDITVQGLMRVAQRDFAWEFGQPPIQNQRGINQARDWWRTEQDRRRERNRR